MIKVVNKRDYKGEGVYIGRPSVLGNPFSIGRDGDREEVLRKYALWFPIEYRKMGAIFNEIWRLKDLVAKGDLTLICWCAPFACHGDVLKQWMDVGWTW